MRFVDLDDMDQKILSLLAENARMSYVDIAAEVGLSRVAVKSRIRALEQGGVIEQYCTIINPARLSNMVSAFFSIEVEPGHLAEVADILAKNEDITQAYQMTGASKLHVHAVVESDEKLAGLLNGVMYKLPGLVRLECDTILARIKDVKGLRL